MEIRNLSIIAHVDHGKTTLVDGLLELTSSLRSKERTERVMDSMDLERERGITIKSKNAALLYRHTKINIIDTPGHADFGGEVERVLSMADCSLLLVDAFDGPMPQTRFVLDKALGLGHRPIVVLNKIDRPGAEPDRALDAVFDLFDELGATSEQLDFPVIYCSARDGYASRILERAGTEDRDLIPLLDLILEHVPLASGNEEGSLQLQIMNLDYDDYVGRLAVGRVFRGRVRAGQNAILCRPDAPAEDFRISKLYGFSGIRREEIAEASCGDIVAVAGLESFVIGDTVCEVGKADPRPPIRVDEPTVAMSFLVNDSPFAGKEGRFVTTRQLRERLLREVRTNVALRVIEDPERPDRFQVQGRGDLHLSILVETMRREGYELQVSRPEVILKRMDGQTLEPYEIVVIDVPEEHAGNLIQELNRRRGSMQSMDNNPGGTTRLEFHVPTRGMIGFRGWMLTESRGSAALTARFLKYDRHAGEMPGRRSGALISTERGESVAFALFNIQERGSLFIGPGVAVYPGMIVGECSREMDLDVNPCKTKKLTNMRASGADEAVRLTPPINMSLEHCLEFLDEDELLEVTPQNLRLRKRHLDPVERRREAKRKTLTPAG
ncbi:MAG: translational GTPase TypA [Spirochaetales bacterium]|nr:translational GTPase TypA [Leptospiraceae bacterium]MCP5482730.1 translational GTPase TypA [Spirochaetales bacterium]MCP5485224.1 translational GTPase TypA [Spirochaetales bacterium]